MDHPLFDSLNTAYAQAMFEEYARNPEGVPPEWRTLFETQGTQAVAEGLFVPDQLNGHRAGAVEDSVTPQTSPTSSAADHLRNALPVVSRPPRS